MKLPNPNCVLQVAGGRGFIMEQRVSNRFRQKLAKRKFRLRPYTAHRRIVTAAHCLPHFPTPHAWESLEDQAYPDLLGVLGEKPNVWAQLLFADPISDIAVLGCPDNQVMFEQADAYDSLVEPLKAIPVGKAQTGKGWLLSLDEPYRWVPTILNTEFGSLLSGPTLAGQSGSPILNEEGQAVGVVVVGGETHGVGEKPVPNETNGPQPTLRLNLPRWLLSR